MSPMKEILEKLIKERSTFKDATDNLISQFQELMQRSEELSHDDKAKDLLKEEKKIIGKKTKKEGKKNNVLYHACKQRARKMLHLNKYKNKRNFLCDLENRLYNEEKIFACQIVGNRGWKYGPISFSDDRFHVHCLSSSTPEKDASLVLLQNMRQCLESKDE